METPMQAWVVYESMFGNTRLIAEAVAGGLTRGMEVRVFEVGAAPPLDQGIDLVVVGGPTHAFGMSRAGSRKSAAEMMVGPLVSPGIGIREWLARLEPPVRAIGAATFDTRIAKPHVPGSAAAAAHRRMRKLGFDLTVEPESFLVDATIGPVLAGEYERAHRWGEGLAAQRVGRALVGV